ncbi:tetratricopeptide repeat protein [Acidobacteriota bacterium]
MRKLKSTVLISLFILFMFSLGYLFPQSGEAQTVLENNQDFIISLSFLGDNEEEVGNGTGFFIGEGVLVTSYHFISQALGAAGINYKGKKIKIEGLLAADKSIDIAILKTKGKSKFMTLGNSDELAPGNKIFALGINSLGELRSDEGTVGNILEISATQNIFDLTVDAPEFIDGGPVVNQDGQVVGVLSFFDLRTKVILPVNAIKALSQSGPVTPLSSLTPENYFETYEGANYAAQTFLALDNSFQAEKFLKQIVKLRPEEIKVHDMLANIYMDQRNYSSAESKYKQIIELQPNRDRAYYGLGMVYIKMLKWQESIAPFQKAVDLNVENKQSYFYIGNAYYELRDFVKAAEFYQQYIDFNPEDISEAYKQLGISLFESKQFVEAAPAFQEALKATPEDLTLNYKLAQAYQNSEMFEKAEQIYLMLTEISPKDQIAYHNTIVRMYDEAKLPDKAVESASRLVDIDPNNAESLFNLGYMLIKQKNYAEAVDIFNKVIEINPGMEYAYLQLGYCHTLLKQYQSSVDVYKKLVEILPENADAWMGIGIGYMQQKKWEPSIAPLKKVIELKPDNGNAYYNLGICYLNLKDNFSANDIYKQLKEIDPNMANKLYGYIK